jgi:chromosome segregation ATPase
MTDECSICLDDLRNDLCTSTSCGHCFHRECYRHLVEHYKNRNQCQAVDANPPCPVCKQRIKKTVKVYLTIATDDFNSSSFQEIQRLNKSAVTSLSENSRLQKRLHELQSVSNDQSDQLRRILPRYNQLNQQHRALKRDQKLLKKQVQVVEDENRELLFDCFDAKAKLKEEQEKRENIAMKLEETVDENKDLFAIWETLEVYLEKSTLKTKEVKAKLKEQLRQRSEELEQVRMEVDQTKLEKNCLKRDLERFQEEDNKLNRMIKQVAKNFKRGSLNGGYSN